MFEKHRDEKERERAASIAQAAVSDWTHQINELRGLVSVASGHSAEGVTALVLTPGEVGVAQISHVSLVEERKGAGQWKGGSQGVSFPIGRIAGRPVRYRVGQTRGHYVQGEPTPTAVDTGILTITSQRIVYQGTNRTAECRFAKLLGIQHGEGGLTVSVSNRQKPMIVHFGVALDDWVSNRLTIALALYHGDAAATVAQLESQIRELEAAKPIG